MFIKYRTNHAWGTTPWEYLEIRDYDEPNNEILQEFCEKIDSKYNYSEKYRGCDAIEVEPSSDWLKKLINANKIRIHELEQKTKFYESLLTNTKCELKKECLKCSNYTIIKSGLFERSKCEAGHSPYIKYLKKYDNLTCPDMIIKE